MLMKNELSTDLLKPKQNRVEQIKVYNSSFFQANKQIEYGKNSRTVHIDPEMVHRLATLGLSREMIANYHGLSKAKFAEALEDYPELEDAFMMGFSAGLAKTAMALEKQIDNGNMVSTIFRMKVGGFIEADKRLKELQNENAPKVQIYLPSNSRDDVDEGTE